MSSSYHHLSKRWSPKPVHYPPEKTALCQYATARPHLSAITHEKPRETLIGSYVHCGYLIVWVGNPSERSSVHDKPATLWKFEEPETTSCREHLQSSTRWWPFDAMIIYTVAVFAMTTRRLSAL